MAKTSTICAVVRSLMPMSTVPPPTGITSPPSSDALPKSWRSNSSDSARSGSGYQNGKPASRNIGEKR